MDALQAYSAFNRDLARGGHAVPPPGLADMARAEALRYPRLGVYTGGGSSHSWLWLAEVFDRLGFYDLKFLDAGQVAGGGLAGLDALALSGGDTFAMARALGPEGANALRRFIQAGGLYLGACAGAYLVMRSSKEPLNLFNFVAAKISNLSKALPQALILPEKYTNAYGCDYVFHPVREAMLLQARGGPLGQGQFQAPLYGGPAMLPAGEGVEVLASYLDFTAGTRFLAPPELAAETLLGKAAVLRGRLGKGTLYLFGPHFEHPGFHEANRMLARAIYWDLPQQPAAAAREETLELSGPEAKALVKAVKRQVSNSRITAVALEDHPARWLIGDKVYEPQKFRVYLEAIWSRLRPLQRASKLAVMPQVEQLPDLLTGITEGIRALKRELAEGEDTTARATGLFKDLNQASVMFLRMYFASARAGYLDPAHGRRLH
jgi:glutamine amidotransferase-like uncharacterized protein